jgi:hypothetical protein
MLRFSRDNNLSTPANDCSLFDRSLIVVIAGRGDLDRDCSDSIIQFDKSSEVNRVSDARLSGISANRLDDRFNDLRLFATGPKLFAGRLVRELSASDRYLSRCHFEEGSTFMLRRFEALSLRCGFME